MAAPPSIDVSLELDRRQADALDFILREFPKDYKKICIRAIKRAGQTGVTACKRAISRELGIKGSGLVKAHRFGARGSQSTGKAIRLDIDDRDDAPSATIRISGRRIPVVWFKPKQMWKSRKTAASQQLGPRARQRVRAGVSWKIGKQGRTKGTMAFFGRGRKGGRSLDKATPHMGVKELGTSGHRGVYKRVGRARLPIVELKGPSIPHVAERNIPLQHALDVDVHQTFAKRLDHEIDRLLKRKAGHG